MLTEVKLVCLIRRTNKHKTNTHTLKREVPRLYYQRAAAPGLVQTSMSEWREVRVESRKSEKVINGSEGKLIDQNRWRNLHEAGGDSTAGGRRWDGMTMGWEKGSLGITERPKWNLFRFMFAVVLRS